MQDLDEKCAAETQRLCDLLNDSDISHEVRSRHVLCLFDRFRSDYKRYISQLHEELQAQRRVFKKFAEIKDQVFQNAMRMAATFDVKDCEIERLQLYREQCVIAFDEAHQSQAREKLAAQVIEQLKKEIEQLQKQVHSILESREEVKGTGSILTREEDIMEGGNDERKRLCSLDEWIERTRIRVPTCAEDSNINYGRVHDFLVAKNSTLSKIPHSATRSTNDETMVRSNSTPYKIDQIFMQRASTAADRSMRPPKLSYAKSTKLAPNRLPQVGIM